MFLDDVRSGWHELALIPRSLLSRFATPVIPCHGRQICNDMEDWQCHPVLLAARRQRGTWQLSQLNVASFMVQYPKYHAG